MDNNNELDDQRMREAERTLSISEKSESILLHKGCITKVVQQCNLENLMMQETSDFGPMEVDAESQNKSPTQAKSERQFQNFEDHEKGDTSEAVQEVTLKMLDTMHTVTMIKDVDGGKKSESMSPAEDRLVDGQRASLLTNQNKANLEDHHPNDSAFPMRIVPTDHISLGPLQGPGSASCRSSSSTTSARSFAFPVFTGEWIGSPVRMAGSGRRHMKRHRWWKRCFGSCSY